jgi:starch synthase
MQVLFVSAEVAPFAKVGGLADVAAGLPPALRALGLDVRVIMPRYGTIEPGAHHLSRRPERFEVVGPDGERLACGLWEARLGGGVPLYLVEEPRYLGRGRVYEEPDDVERFALFCRAVLGAARALRLEPDVLHLNDWHTALLAAWLGFDPASRADFAATASLLTIHNLAFQGWFNETVRARWALAPAEICQQPVAGQEAWSTMALGLRYADLITTVSPTYAREILTPEQGAGLDPLLRLRQQRVHGVVNGLDLALFNPATDPSIEAHYDLDSLAGKALAKAALQRRLGLPEQADLPLIAFIGRLYSQKGVTLLAPTLTALLAEQQVQVVVLGTGDLQHERALSALQAAQPDRAAVKFGFDLELAQQIYAGADLFLMPSQYEPCGLGQLIALRYGTVPLVRATGGLADTVHDRTEAGERANGFVFRAFSPEALLIGLARAVEAYRCGPVWRQLQRTGMQADLSWSKPAERYLALYEQARAYQAAGA